MSEHDDNSAEPDSVETSPSAPDPAPTPTSSSPYSKISLISLFFILFIGGLFLGRYVFPAGELKYEKLQFVTVEDGERKLIFPTFWEAWDQLHSNFIDIEEVDDQELYYGAVAGMVRALDDPYTVFSPPVETKQFEETISGSFSGVGIEIGVRGGLVTVIAPIAGSPAEAAGMLSGDIIIGVDGNEFDQDTNLDQVVRQIRGPRGEEVVLKIARQGESAPLDIGIIRDTIKVESVKLSFDELVETVTEPATTSEDGSTGEGTEEGQSSETEEVAVEDGEEADIAYIEITNFNGDTAKRFLKAANDIKDNGVDGLIIDVRSNPGGFLDAAVDMASRFLDKDAIVVAEKGKNDKNYLAKGNPILQDIPVIVLVNGGSASASEILAGALRDHVGAPIIGTKTFGKGSVQEFLKLSDGSSLRVTIAKWFTPNGHSINDQGIEPDIVVEDNRDTPEDEQLDRAQREMRIILGLQEAPAEEATDNEEESGEDESSEEDTENSNEQ